MRRPSCSSVKPISGRAIASRFTTSRQAAYSARGAAQELAPRRHLVEQVLDANAGAGRKRGRPLARPVRHGRSSIRQPSAPAHPAFDRQPRDAGDRRQRLAAKAEARDLVDRVVGQLRGGVPLEREAHFVRASCRSRRRPPRSARFRRRSARPRSWLAPASIAFSTSSFSALAGRSTTSPAAMRLTSSGAAVVLTC